MAGHRAEHLLTSFSYERDDLNQDRRFRRDRSGPQPVDAATFIHLYCGALAQISLRKLPQNAGSERITASPPARHLREGVP